MRTPELRELVKKFSLEERLSTRKNVFSEPSPPREVVHVFTEQERTILEVLRKGPTTIPFLSQLFELSKEGVVKILFSLHGKGYDVFEDTSTGKVSFSLDSFAPSNPLEIEPVTFRNSIKFGVVCDTRLGDASSQLSLLYDAYQIFEERKIDFVIHAGNVVAGDRPKARQEEVFLSNEQSQRQFMIDQYPRASFRTYLIAGPLDLTWKKKKGYNIVRDVCTERDDLIYRGDEAATFKVKGNQLYVDHPGNDDTPYAKSYKPQKIAENLVGYLRSIGKRGKDIPQIAIMGGWHVEDQLFGQFPHGVYVVPSFISQNKFLAKKHIAPAIGCLIVEMFFDNDGNIIDVRPEYITFNKYQVDRDYLSIPSSSQLDNGCTLTTEEREMLELIKWEPLSPGELSRRLNKSKRKIHAMVERLQACGYEITIPKDTDQVTLSIGLKTKYGPVGILKRFGKSFKFGAISDTHYCSKHQQPGLCRMAYEIFDKEDVDLIVHGGDVSDGGGMYGYRGHLQDVFIVGLDDQKKQIVMEYPRSKKDIETKVIGGNHDGWDIMAAGYDIVRHICDERDDLEYLGHLSGRFEHEGIRFKVLHPAGGVGYAKSYKPQRLIEGDISSHILALESEDGEINIQLLGNWHHYHFIHYMGTYSFTLPCLKTTDDFHETRGLAPFLGVVVVEVALDTSGDIIAISPKFVNLAPFAKEKDY